MGVQKLMNTFFASMQGQNASGYGGRIVNTPLGPFQWDDNLNVWININNGMTLNNISFQDEFASMAYDTLGGGGTPDAVTITGTVLTPSSWGNFTGMTGANALWWSSSTGPQLSSSNATTVTLSNIPTTITVTLTVVKTSGTGTLSVRRFIKNGGSSTSYSTGITMASGDTLKLGLQTPVSGIANGILSVFDSTNGVTLESIPYSYDTSA